MAGEVSILLGEVFAKKSRIARHGRKQERFHSKADELNKVSNFNSGVDCKSVRDRSEIMQRDVRPQGQEKRSQVQSCWRGGKKR